ncbi:Rad52/Rad22 family DNA repair protein [Streptomyces sp. NPDC047515]|uniref:Rad52/Rad22 family DNA repair protein n=1 Tax=Streptomyces sp. NPDC047515 TaxID=3155380 RepID=UPI0033DE2FF2
MAIEAPASSTAEGPTSHTQNQATRFTAPQLRLLHRPVDPKRIGKDDKGFAHMEAWDIKRYLLRVFGFAGYDTENRELTLVREIETPNGNRSKWTVVYRAQVRLIVKDVHGQVLGHWDGEAAGVGNNLPNLGDSHDMAMKTATSQALKRAATHLGDAFGLSLYNNGSPLPVVNFSAAHPPEQWEKAAAPVPEPNDPPVQPEPGTRTPDEPSPAPTIGAAPANVGLSDAERATHLTRLMGQVANLWENRNPLPLIQIKGDAEEHSVLDDEVQGPPPGREWMTLRKLLDDRIADLNQRLAQHGDAEKGAA